MKLIQTFGKTITLTGSLAADDDAIKTSIATSTSVATYSGAGLTGVLGAGPYTFARTITVATSASAVTYNTTLPIVVTGTDSNGTAITANLLLTAGGGNQTIATTKPFYSVTSIAVPAQLLTTGAFIFGVKDYFIPGTVLEVRVKTAGSLHVKYNGGTTDTISALAGDRLPYSPIQVYSDSTAQDITFCYES